MIILDTNVVSEAMKTAPNQRVELWIASLPSNEAAVTAITLGEISLGLALLPQGRRRGAQERDWNRVRTALVEDRVLPFDADAGDRLGPVIATRRAAGAPIDLADAQIAAIALTRSLPLATRNTADFQGLGLQLINPWSQ